MVDSVDFVDGMDTDKTHLARARLPRERWMTSILSTMSTPSITWTSPMGSNCRIQVYRAPIAISLCDAFDLDGRADALERFLDLLGFVFVDAFLHGLRGGVNQVFGFLESESGQGAHLFNDLDLL